MSSYGSKIVDMCREESVVVNLCSSDVKSNMTGQRCSAYHKNRDCAELSGPIIKSSKYVFNMSQTHSIPKGISNRRAGSMIAARRDIHVHVSSGDHPLHMHADVPPP